MRKNKIIICLPIEAKNRELLSKTFLAYKLLKKINCEILIGDRKTMFIDFDKSKNLIYFYKGGGKHLTKNFFNHVKKNNFLFTLDEEGPIFEMFDWDIENKISKKYCRNFNGIFVWGKKDLFIYKNKVGNLDNISVTGHPKYDLLKNPYKKIFSKDVLEIKKKYKDFVFFPSHYGSDYKMDINKYKAYLRKIYPKQINKVSNWYAQEKIFYLEIVVLLKTMAKKNPDKYFIFRPHPGQDIKLVKKTFGEIPKNLKIIYKYTVTPWIIACDLFVHSGCTTSYEAKVLNKKIIHIQDINDSSQSAIIGHVFKKNYGNINYNKLQDLINNKIILKSPNIRDKIKNSIEFNYFYKNFLNYLKEKNFLTKEASLFMRHYNLENNFFKKTLSYLKQKFINFGLLRLFNNRLPDYFLISKKIKDSKIKNLSRFELLNILNSFENLDNSKKMKLNIKKINKNSFKIISQI